MSTSKNQPSWARLFRVACDLIRQVNSETKKIVHRGSSIKPRDIFDIAAAAEQYADPIVAELRSYRTEVTRSLEALESLNPEFVNNAISQLLIRQEFAAIAKTAIKRTKQILRAV